GSGPFSAELREETSRDFGPSGASNSRAAPPPAARPCRPCLWSWQSELIFAWGRRKRVDGWSGLGHRPAVLQTCCRSSAVERILGKAEVVSSILTGSTIILSGL